MVGGSPIPSQVNTPRALLLSRLMRERGIGLLTDATFNLGFNDRIFAGNRKVVVHH